MKIAVVGAGISGLIAASILDAKHEVFVFEKNSRLGGHSHTVQVEDQNGVMSIDTGFIVCNSVNYPNFLKLLNNLQVDLQKTSMSFSVSSDKLEYSGTSLNGLFSQRNNIINPRFWRLLSDIIKFNKAAKNLSEQIDFKFSLQEFIANLNLSELFINYYLLPMISAIWSVKNKVAMQMPAKFICQFFDNHGLLNINSRPQWYSITGGSQVYVKKILQKLKNVPLISSPVTSIKRQNSTIQVLADKLYEFDKVIIATHSDEALKMLADASAAEQSVLESIPYTANEVVLHTDVSLLPVNKRAWSSWNCKVDDRSDQNCTVTYNMNMLQNLNAQRTYCVSLNQTNNIKPELILGKFNYSHPVLDIKAAIAKQRFYEISGNGNNTYFAGAYWGNGFHEDGVNSGLRAVKQIDEELFCKAQYTLDW